MHVGEAVAVAALVVAAAQSLCMHGAESHGQHSCTENGLLCHSETGDTAACEYRMCYSAAVGNVAVINFRCQLRQPCGVATSKHVASIEMVSVPYRLAVPHAF